MKPTIFETLEKDWKSVVKRIPNKDYADINIILDQPHTWEPFYQLIVKVKERILTRVFYNNEKDAKEAERFMKFMKIKLVG